MKSDAQVTGYYEDGLVFDDGSTLGADVIVFATGFEGNMKVMIRDLFSDDVAAQLEDFWGLDDEGEIQGAFRPSGRKCMLYFASILLAAAREHKSVKDLNRTPTALSLELNQCFVL